MTHLVRIGVTFREFKLIVGRINSSYSSPLFLISTPTDSDQWCGLTLYSFQNVCEGSLIIRPLCPAAGFGQNRKQEVTRYDHVCDVTNKLLQRPATSWILLKKVWATESVYGLDIAGGGHVSRCSADLCHFTQGTVCN